MPRLTVDVELMMVQLLSAALPDVEVVGQPDVDMATRLPMVVVQPGTGRMISNGGPAMGWSWEISLSILGTGHQFTSDLADTVYQEMHGFHDRQASAAGGHINHVDDISMPVRSGTAVELDNLTQFDGSWVVVVVPN